MWQKNRRNSLNPHAFMAIIFIAIFDSSYKKILAYAEHNGDMSLIATMKSKIFLVS